MSGGELGQLILASLLSGAVVSSVMGLVFHQRTTRLTETIGNEFDRRLSVFQSTRAWQEQSVSELLGPMHLDRTERAFKRWSQKNLFLEAKVIGDGNLRIRDLLLAKGYLIPLQLLEDAGALVEHYDRWLEQFEEVRLNERPNSDSPFVFVGPEGYPFPRRAAQNFAQAFKDAWVDLYGGEAP